MHEATARQIESILRERLKPRHLELEDESARHAGHPGASSGGGHYRVTIVSEAFEGCTRLEQHRMVNEALRELFGDRIHALALTTRTPAQWGEEKKNRRRVRILIGNRIIPR